MVGRVVRVHGRNVVEPGEDFGGHSVRVGMWFNQAGKVLRPKNPSIAVLIQFFVYRCDAWLCVHREVGVRLVFGLGLWDASRGAGQIISRKLMRVGGGT